MTTTTATNKSNMAGLMLGSVGIVYGDIGTSPLYAIKEVFGGAHAIAPTLTNILGVLSLIFWALFLIVSVKYIFFIMEADNRGEGGIMSLLTLALRSIRTSAKNHHGVYLSVLSLGIFGVGLFYGDAIITPAISVLSAIEGLQIANPSLQAYVVPLALLVLVLLFSVQRQGTGKVGHWFGPIMVLWFLTLGVLGLLEIIKHPLVLLAINPYYAVTFFIHNQWLGFLALGAIVLVVTGAEALYADRGHFGPLSLRYAWFGFVWPALLLNYFGQGALLIENSAAVANPFYLLAPTWGLYPLVILSTFASIIASQAVISGTFSITQQASRLGYLPRVEILHTSAEQRGQIYIPVVNFLLFIVVVSIVLFFGSSTKLAAAYGVAVTGTMLITTLLACVVLQHIQKWSVTVAILIIYFLVIDVPFFSANILKIVHGGWLPLLIGVITFTIMITWKQGNELIKKHYHSMPQAGIDRYESLNNFIASLSINPPLRVQGTAIFLTQNPYLPPRTLLHNLMHNKILHDKIIILNVMTHGIPYVKEEDRAEITELKDNFFSMTLNYGFKEDHDVPATLVECQNEKLIFLMMETSFFFGHETLVSTVQSKLYRWQKKLFFFLFRNSLNASLFYKIPSNRVVELGAQIEL